jgi:hypothetical protein
MRKSRELFGLFMMVLFFFILSSRPVMMFSCTGTDVKTALSNVRKSKKDLTKIGNRLQCLVCEEFLHQPDTFDTLAAALEEDNPNVRIFAVRLLDILEDSRAIELLKSHLKIEEHPDIRDMTEFSIKDLSEMKEQGRLTYLDGIKMPRINYKPISSHETYKVKTSRKKSYRVTDLYDIRQSIAKNGFIHFVYPHNYIMFMETHRFKFGLGFAHLEVFDKRNKYWHLYTYSDGFGPFCIKDQTFPRSMENFKDCLAVIGCTHAFIFDKATQQISRLSLMEFETFKKSHPLEPPLDIRNPSQWKSLSQAEKTKLAGRLFDNEWNLGGASFIRSNDRLMVANTGIGLQVFNENGETGFIDPPSGLFGSRILNADFRENLLMIRYNDKVDIFDTQKTFKLLHRLDVPPPKEQQHNCQQFDKSCLYMTLGSDYIIIRLDTGETITRATLDSEIFKMAQDDHSIYLMTALGLGIWNKNLQVLETYPCLKNPTEKDSSTHYRESKRLEWIGKTGHYLLGKRIVSFIDSGSITPIFFDTEKKQFAKREEVEIPGYTFGYTFSGKNNFPYVYEGSRYWLVKDGKNVEILKKGKGTVARFEMTDPPYKPWFPETNSFSHSPVYNENVGYELVGVCFTGDTLWIKTHYGLFSFGIKTRLWKHYNIVRPEFFNQDSDDIIANKFGIYSRWSFIDRDSFKIGHLDYIPTGHIKLSPGNGNTALFTHTEGISTYHFPTGQLQTLKLSDQISQIGFYKSHLVAAGEERLFFLDEKLNILKTFPLEPLKKEQRTYNRFPYQLAFENNRVWLAYGNRIVRFDLDSGERPLFHYPRQIGETISR